MAEYFFSGNTDIGYKRTVNEDYIDVVQLANDVVFAVVADGMGSRPSDLQPARIVCEDICSSVKNMYANNPEAFLSNSEAFLKIAVQNANRVIGAFKVANEELYSGFGSTLTCCLLDGERNLTFVHIGNSRLYLIRNRKGVTDIRQLTNDHTRAKELLDLGKISEEEYYTHPERAKLTSTLGFVSDPDVQSLTASAKEGDIIYMSTDGIHYAVRPEAMLDIIIQSDNCNSAVENLIYAAKSQHYADNMSAIVVFVK